MTKESKDKYISYWLSKNKLEVVNEHTSSEMGDVVDFKVVDGRFSGRYGKGRLSTIINKGMKDSLISRYFVKFSNKLPKYSLICNSI